MRQRWPAIVAAWVSFLWKHSVVSSYCCTRNDATQWSSPLRPATPAAFTTSMHSCPTRRHSDHGRLTVQWKMSMEDFDDIDSTKFAYLERVRQEILKAGHEEEWDKSVQLLTKQMVEGQVLLSLNAAQDVLARAWRWKAWAVVTSPTARRFVPAPIPPNATIIGHSLAWLCDDNDCDDHPLAAISVSALRAGIVQCPHSFLLAPQATYQSLVRHIAPDECRSNPPALHELLRTKPTLFCATTNCADVGCQSDCGTCWVSLAR
jgi:hypothetical protein